MNWTLLIESYLNQKRQLGYSLMSEGHCLQSFSHYAEQLQEETLTIKLALEWAKLAPSGSKIAVARRFSILRPFSRYLVNLGFDAVILPTHFIGPTHRRLPPYIFSEKEILSLMKEANELFPENGLRPITMKTFIGLLASTGLRPGEAVRLMNQDVNLGSGEISIHNSKGWKQRVIPLSLSTIDELKLYVKYRDRFDPLHQKETFFKLDYQHSFNINSADYAFKLLRKSIGLSVKFNGRYPRLYDIRHTFVCRRVTSWYQAGIDVDTQMAQLSQYLGHKKVSDTYWYLTAIPELMSYASKQFSDNFSIQGERQ